MGVFNPHMSIKFVFYYVLLMATMKPLVLKPPYFTGFFDTLLKQNPPIYEILYGF